MPDLGMSVAISRTLLGLAPLQINDHLSYYIAPQFLGAAVSWNRQQVTGPFHDGAVTTYRSRQMVSEQIGVEVLGESPAQLNQNVAALLAAFSQDSFTMTVAIGLQQHEYACEASDYQLTWSGPRLVAQQLQVLFTVPRQPVTIQGAY